MLGNSPTVGSTIGGSGLTITALISMRAWEMFVSCVPWIYPDPPKLIKLRSRPAADVFATRSTPTSVPNTLDIQLPKIYPPQKGMVSDRISTSIRILISAIIASVYIITCIYIHIIIYIYIYISECLFKFRKATQLIFYALVKLWLEFLNSYANIYTVYIILYNKYHYGDLSI